MLWVAHWGLTLNPLHHIVAEGTYGVKNICLHIFRCYDITYTKYRLIFSRVHATLQPALFIGRLVGWSVGWSVTLYFFYDFISLTSLILPK